jgi:hypothetical protein
MRAKKVMLLRGRMIYEKEADRGEKKVSVSGQRVSGNGHFAKNGLRKEECCEAGNSIAPWEIIR